MRSADFREESPEQGKPLGNMNRRFSLSYEDLLTRAFLLALGLLFLLPATYKLYSYGLFRCRAVSVDGVVVDASRGRDIGGRPLVAYKDRQGHTYEKKSNAKTHWLFAPRVGEKMTVFYDKDDPHTAIVDNAFHYIFLPLGFILAGAYFLRYVLRI